MFFQIKEIILWPKNRSFKPRRLTFKPGLVNVISGSSRTGKSAIIPIIDYCLGSEKCSIPVNTVRDACAWFGIVVQTEFGEKLFARREPGDSKTTGDMFVIEGASIKVPVETPNRNTNADAVKRTLDELAGLTALDFDSVSTSSGFRGRPSFRDLTAFIFQPQNIVANPDILFYKADTYEHREKLRTIFPYVLNAVTPEILAQQHELSQIQKELRRKDNELQTIRGVSERWIAEIQAIATEAKELGLVGNVEISILDKDQLIDILHNVVSASKDEVLVTEETISDAIQELVGLQKEESGISLKLSSLRKRLVEMTNLKESTSQYKDALQVQRDRLAISEWLHNVGDSEQICPICGSSLSSSSEHLSALYQALQDIEQSAGDFKTVPAAFDREFERIKTEIRLETEHLKAARIRREALETTSESARQRQYDSLRVARFIGNLEQSLQVYERLGRDNELETEVEDLQKRVADLEKEISEGEVRGRTKRAIRNINLLAGRLMPQLDTERPNDPISLSVDDLTIKVEGSNREDYLWEIGSGSNWLSYHVAISLALQQFFLSLPRNSVPSFLVFDQPSQVYFPKRLAASDTEEDTNALLRDEDVVAVQKIFQVLSNAVQESRGNLQIIVLDHASEDLWGDIHGIASIEEWRDGKKLVPIEWL